MLPKVLDDFINSKFLKTNLSITTKAMNKIAAKTLICRELRPNKACLDKIHINAIKMKHK